MTPKTVSLDPGEWKALLVANAERLHGGLSALVCPNPAEVTAIDQHLDRMKALVVAWHRAGVPVVNPVANDHGALNAAYAQTDAALRAATIQKPKGKPGWPKGKLRGPRKQK